jgi:hypothetical protein
VSMACPRLAGHMDETGTLCCDALVPLVLTHVSFTQRAVLESANEVAVARLATAACCCSAAAPSLVGVCIHVSIWRRRIICGTGLESNWRVGIQVACHSLNGGWDTLWVHSRCSLTARTCCSLCIETLRWDLAWAWAWHHSHLVAVARWLLGWIWRWCSLIHAVVHGRRLSLGWRVELVHLHGVGILHMR